MNTLSAKIWAAALLLLTLSGCGEKRAGPNALDVLTEEFAQARAAAVVDYGVVTVVGKEQNVVATDCMVFEQAALARPVSLGQTSAWADSMYYRAVLGCGNDTTQALALAESSRRLLLERWRAAVEQLPAALRDAAGEGAMGRVVAASVSRAINEGTACLAGESFSARYRRGGGGTLKSLTSKCSSVFAFNLERSCTEAWSVVAAHQSASGAKDDDAFLFELLSRYRMMYFVCSPNATNEYRNFHATVPARLFEGPAYRLRIPVDPIMACAIGRVQIARGKKRWTTPQQEHVRCGTEIGYTTVYLKDAIPDRFTRKTLDTGKWLFNPLTAGADPERWRLGGCEMAVIADMKRRGLNAASPEALGAHCRK